MTNNGVCDNDVGDIYWPMYDGGQTIIIRNVMTKACGSDNDLKMTMTVMKK